MITGVGVDLVNIERFRTMSSSHRDKLALRILCDTEFDDYLNSKNKINALAKYWAVKEAVAKSFGTGIRGDVVWKNILLQYTNLGQPLIKLQNSLELKNKKCYISISHDNNMVIAHALLTDTENTNLFDK